MINTIYCIIMVNVILYFATWIIVDKIKESHDERKQLKKNKCA